MRTRIAVLAASLGTVAALSAPAVAAADSSQAALTLAAAPSHILAGQSMLIYGHLAGSDNAGQQIVLYHKIAGQPSFTIIQKTMTNSQGNFEFIRPDGIVNTNRQWYATGPNGAQSQTISESVAALVSLNTSSATTLTGEKVVLSGHVFPAHPYQLVLIQEQSSLTGNGWKTIVQTTTNAGSSFAVAKGWRLLPTDAGAYTLRAVLKENAENVRSFSDSITETVQQKENPSFTINSSSQIIPEGSPVTLSGVLDQAGTSTPLANTQVTLFGKVPGPDNMMQALATTVTDANGNYSFTESPTTNMVYVVRTTLKPKAHSSVLFEGVQDQVSAQASTTTTTVGTPINVTGSVTPDKTGSLITLEELNANGNWQIVQYGTVESGSQYSFSVQFGQTGTVQLRVHISGDPNNVGNNSAAIPITVNGVAPVSSLPTPSS
jgi:hypothetical protein